MCTIVVQEAEHISYDSSGGSGTQEGDSATVCNLIECCEELGLGATAASIKQSTLNSEQYQLDAEYIERVLGLLTPMQASLAQLFSVPTISIYNRL